MEREKELEEAATEEGGSSSSNENHGERDKTPIKTPAASNREEVHGTNRAQKELKDIPTRAEGGGSTKAGTWEDET